MTEVAVSRPLEAALAEVGNLFGQRVNQIRQVSVGMPSRSHQGLELPLRGHSLQIVAHRKSLHVRFSNRPFDVKRFQTIRRLRCRCHSRARASLRNRTKAFENEVEQSVPRPCRQTLRRVQADMRTHLIHRPARDIIPPLIKCNRRKLEISRRVTAVVAVSPCDVPL